MKKIILLMGLLPALVFAAQASQSSVSAQTTTVSQDAAQAKKKVNKTLGDITGNQPSALQQKLSKQYQAASSPFGITFYEPTYVLPFYYTGSPDYAVYQNSTPDNQQVKHAEFKAQLSLLVPVWQNILGWKGSSLNIAYTQLSYWQFYAKSQYFRETDYAPTVFLSYNFRPNWWIDAGAVHQSNGRGGEYERSWNRAYLNLRFSGRHWMVSWKPWVLIFKAESSNLHNPDIRHYLGNGRIVVAYKFGRNVISLMTRNNLQSGFKRGAEELTWSIHIWKHFSLYLQGFSGYGQSLIEYNHRTNSGGIGVALNDWL